MSTRKPFIMNHMIRKNYVIFLELGLIATLVLFLIAFKVDFRSEVKQEKVVEKQETVSIEEVIQTRQENEPPPPPRPAVPIEVPNDEVIAEAELNINADIVVNQKLDIPAPPAAPKEEETEQIFVVVEQQPELIGGLAALQAKLSYPIIAARAGIEGRVYLQFIVDTKGEVVDPVVVRGIGGGCDKEALRVIKEAKFRPGMQRGRPVNVRYSMPIMFKLDEEAI